MKDPLKFIPLVRDLAPPIDMNCPDSVYQYTDDLVTIHEQLELILKQKGKSMMYLLLCARVRQAFREYFDQGLLECWDKDCENEEGVQFIIDAHKRVIELFHALWGVLPSKDIDDYRNLGTEPVSLSEDFISEAVYGITTHQGWSYLKGVERESNQHSSKGIRTYPIWVDTAENLFQRWEGVVGDKDDDGNVHLDCLGPFKPAPLPKGGWIIDNTVYVNAEIFGIEGTKWPKVRWMTMQEISLSYQKRTNDDGKRQDAHGLVSGARAR